MEIHDSRPVDYGWHIMMMMHTIRSCPFCAPIFHASPCTSPGPAGLLFGMSVRHPSSSARINPPQLIGASTGTIMFTWNGCVAVWLAVVGGASRGEFPEIKEFIWRSTFITVWFVCFLLVLHHISSTSQLVARCRKKPQFFKYNPAHIGLDDASIWQFQRDTM